MSEMAIKNANDTVVSTEETYETASLSTVSDHKTSSDNIVSNNNDAEKTKNKDRSGSSTSESKKICKSKKSSSKDKKKNNTAGSKKNEKMISLIKKVLTELYDLDQEHPSIGSSIGSEEHKIPSHIFVKSRRRPLSDEALGYSSDDDSISSSEISVTSNISTITSPWTAKPTKKTQKKLLRKRSCVI